MYSIFSQSAIASSSSTVDADGYELPNVTPYQSVDPILGGYEYNDNDDLRGEKQPYTSKLVNEYEQPRYYDISWGAEQSMDSEYPGSLFF